MSLKIFKMNEFDYYADFSLKEAKEHFAAEMGTKIQYVCDNPRELTEQEMNELLVYTDLHAGIISTFAEEIVRREEKPHIFTRMVAPPRRKK